jgi:TonB family protein
MLEQALTSAELMSSVEDPSLRYALQVQDRIAKAIRYPLREQDLSVSGRVKVRLHLFRDGSLGQAIVSESSGVDAFDQEAIKVTEAQAPYPPFPSGLVQPDLWLEIPVLFRP